MVLRHIGTTSHCVLRHNWFPCKTQHVTDLTHHRWFKYFIVKSTLTTETHVRTYGCYAIGHRTKHHKSLHQTKTWPPATRLFDCGNCVFPKVSHVCSLPSVFGLPIVSSSRTFCLPDWGLVTFERQNRRGREDILAFVVTTNNRGDKTFGRTKRSATNVRPRDWKAQPYPSFVFLFWNSLATHTIHCYYACSFVIIYKFGFCVVVFVDMFSLNVRNECPLHISSFSSEGRGGVWD